MSETRTCQASFHPFKQQTYTYRGEAGLSSEYCSSCKHHIEMTFMFLQATFMPRATLYGMQDIEINRDEAHVLVDMYFDDKHLKEAKKV